MTVIVTYAFICTVNSGWYSECRNQEAEEYDLVLEKEQWGVMLREVSFILEDIWLFHISEIIRINKNIHSRNISELWNGICHSIIFGVFFLRMSTFEWSFENIFFSFRSNVLLAILYSKQFPSIILNYLLEFYCMKKAKEN